MYQHAHALRIIGYVVSLILTLASYFVMLHPEPFSLSVNWAVLTIFIFAFLQAIVQIIFFLDFWREKGIPWNSGVFVSTILIIFTIIAFSIWIMSNLDYRMMPQPFFR